MSTAFLALLGTFVGGGLVAIIQVFFLPKAKEADIATQIRNELRTDLQKANGRIDDLECEVEYYRTNQIKIFEIIIKNGIDIPAELLMPFKREQ